jgi:hypothetical protein
MVTLTLAGLSLVMGLAMLAWAQFEGNVTGRLVGCVYLACCAVCLAVYGLASLKSPFATKASTTAGALLENSAGARDGMALLMVLLLMALLSGTLLHSMVQTRQRLRLAEWRQERELLRSAAMDAALTTLRDGALGRPLPTKAHAEARLPSEIVTRTLLRPVDRSALPRALQRPEAPVFGDCFSLETEASRKARSRSVRALICRAPDNSLRVLGWVEAL